MRAVLILVVALLLRVVPINHGLPEDFERDAEFPHAALAMLAEGEPVPRLHDLTHLPYLTAYMMIPVYGIQYVAGRVTGAWSDIETYKLYLLTHPGTERLLGRLLVALLGVLTVWLTYVLAQKLGLKTGAEVAAWLVATSLLHVHMSTQERSWVPMVFFIAGTLYFSLRHSESGAARDLVLACVAAALAASIPAIPQFGRVVLGIPGVAWYISPRAWRWPDLKKRLWLAGLCLAIFTGLTLVAGRPYLLRYADQPVLLVLWEQAYRAAGTFFFQADFLLTSRGIPEVFRWQSIGTLVPAFLSDEPVLVALGLPGILLALRYRGWWPGLIFLVLWATLQLGHRNGHVEPDAPLTLLLALPAGLTAERLWRLRRVRPLILALLTVPLVVAIRYDIVMRRADTRVLAEAKLQELPADLLIGIDDHGPQPLLTRSALELRNQLRWRLGHALSGQRGVLRI